MTQTTTIDVNRPLTILSIALLASVTPSAVLLGPLVVGALVTELGFSPQQGGNMIFAELGGAAFATFPAFWWLANINWRKVLYCALAITIVGNLISATVGDPWGLGVIRFGTGIGVGTIMLVTLTTTGLTSNQERVFGFWQTGQIVFAAIALFTMPFVIPKIGVQGFYIALAVVMAMLTLAVNNFPEGGAAAPRVSLEQIRTSRSTLSTFSARGSNLFLYRRRGRVEFCGTHG